MGLSMDAGRRPVRDAGGLDLDGRVLFPGEPIDAGQEIPGEPPPELAGEQCAVDTNKLFDVITLDRQAVPAQMAVDPIESRFGLAFVGDSDQCSDAVYLATVRGPAGVGMPEVEAVADECTTVLQAAVARVPDHWLVATIDARMDMYDVWVQPHGGATELAAQRISETLARESEVVIAAVDLDRDAMAFDWAALVGWTDRDEATGVSTLNVRAVAADGTPSADVVVLEESDTWQFTSLTMSRVSDGYAAFGYRRFDGAGRSEIVLELIEADTGERGRDPWVITAEAGPYGSVELGTDARGGGLIYSIGQGTSAQIWFQLLDDMANAGRVMAGAQVGEAAAPVRVVAPPTSAIDASMAKLPIGFAVAYRKLPGITVDSPRISVHFLDRVGRVIDDSDLALASEFGGRTAIEAGFDGRISVAWSDSAEDGTTTFKLVKLPCVGN